MPSFRSEKRLTADELICDLRNITGARRLEIDGPPGRFRCETEAIEESGIVVIKQTLEAGLEIGVNPERDAFVFLHTLAGTTTVEFEDHDAHVAAGGGYILSDRDPYVLRASPKGTRMVTSVDAGLVKHVMAEHFGRSPKDRLQLAPTFDGASGPGLILYHIANALLCSENQSQAGQRSQKRLLDALVLHVIDGFAHNHPDTSGALTSSVLPRQVKMAQDLMEESALENLSIIEIAEQIGVSARALQYAFLRHCGMTPVSYYRLIRLRRAVGELSTAGELPLRDVAQKWGFTNLGRFSALCLKEFGKRPHEIRTKAN